MFKNLIVALLVLSAIVTKAQGNNSAVTLAQLQQAVHPSDSTAPAAYLYNKGKSWFEMRSFRWFLITEVSCRIKVYKTSGYDFINKEAITFSRDPDKEQIFTNACTYNLTGTAIERSPLTNEGIYTTKTEVSVRQKITMPNVHKGSIVEYTYKITTPLFYINEWQFQQEIPVDYSEYEISIPEFLSFNQYLKGFETVAETLPVRVRQDNYTVNKVGYVVKNVPPLKEEAYVNNINNYLSSVRFELSSTDYYHGLDVKKFSTDWQAVATSIHDREDFGKQTEPTGFFKGVLRTVINDKMNRAEKAAAILRYVQDKMTWNGEYGYICDTGIKKAFAAHTGNVGDINLMLVNMLREANLDANAVLISTRKHGMAVYPSTMAYNYVIAAVANEGNLILLDATSKYSMPDILPIRALNDVGRMIVQIGAQRDHRYFAKEVPLYAKTISKENYAISAKVGPGGIVSGRARAQLYDYFGYMAAENMTALDDETLRVNLEKDKKGLEAEDYKVLNKSAAGGKPLVQEYSFKDTGSAEMLAGKLYVNPLLYMAEAVNPFGLDDRQYPVDFIFPFRHTFQIRLEIPEGFVAEHIPENKKEQFAGTLGEYNFAVSVNGNVIQVYFSFGMNTAIVQPEHYAALKDFFRSLIEKQNEKIVLKKA